MVAGSSQQAMQMYGYASQEQSEQQVAERQRQIAEAEQKSKSANVQFSQQQLRGATPIQRQMASQQFEKRKAEVLGLIGKQKEETQKISGQIEAEYKAFTETPEGRLQWAMENLTPEEIQKGKDVYSSFSVALTKPDKATGKYEMGKERVQVGDEVQTPYGTVVVPLSQKQLEKQYNMANESLQSKQAKLLQELAPVEIPKTLSPTMPTQFTKVTTELPYQTRGTIVQGGRTEYTIPYEPYKFGITEASKGTQEIVSNIAKLSGAGWEKIISSTGFKGVPVSMPETLLPYQLKGTITPDITKQLSATKEVRVLTPKGVGQAVTIGTELGAYSIPYFGTALIASHIPTGYEKVTAPIPKLSDVQITAEARPEGITDTEWSSYTSKVKEYNKSREDYIKSLKTQRIMGGVELVVSAAFLGYKGYKLATKPIVISAKPPKPISTFRGAVSQGKARVEILTIQPGRNYIRTTPLKEGVFWATGKKIDLAAKFITPTKVRFTEAAFLVNQQGARGIGAGTKVGDITTRTVSIPTKSYPLKIDYLKLVKQAPPKTISPFEIQAVRNRLVSTKALTPVERKIIFEIGEKTAGVPRPVSTIPLTGKGVPKYFKSDVLQLKGIPVIEYAPNLKIRLVKSGAKSKTYFIETRPPTVTEVGKSIQITKVPKPYFSIESPEGKVDYFKTFVGSKSFKNAMPTTRGSIDFLPGEVKVIERYPTASQTIAKTFTPVKRFRTINDFITSPAQKQAETALKLIKSSNPIIQVQKVSEVATALSKIKTVSVPILKSATKQIPYISSATGAAVSLVSTQALSQPIMEKPRIEIAQKEIVVVKEIPKVETTMGSAVLQTPTQRQAIIEVSVLSPKLETPLITKPIIRPTTIEPPRTPIPIIPLPKRKKIRRIYQAKEKEPTLFVPFVRRKGKFMPVTAPTTKEKAVQFGVSRLRETLGASLQIRTTKGEKVKFGKTTPEFRFGGRAEKDVFTIVQRAPKRLSSRSERSAIVSAQRRKAGRIKFI